MKNKAVSKIKSTIKSTRLWFFALLLLVLVLFFLSPEIIRNKISYLPQLGEAQKNDIDTAKPEQEETIAPAPLPFDIAAYNKKMEELANNPPDPIVFQTVKTVEKDKNGKSITKITKVPLSPQPVLTHLWPIKTVYPNAGAILPFNRIVAYYGNLYSKNMGVLGEYPEDEMLQKLNSEVQKWNAADPSTPAIPALHYIAVVAQGTPGQDGKYRTRMPFSEIDKVIAMAKKDNALVFLDVQVGFSDVQTEVPLLEKYLKMPQVHLAIDPEFSMKTGIKPGKVVGTLDASDINFVSNYLAKIVKDNNLTPKILIVHRYTEKMVTNYKEIKTFPEVQIVMNMDGWGEAAKKVNTYEQFIYSEPVQFTGFKLFYKNDILTPGSVMMTPNDLMKLNPQPIYIQYQ
jgi:hypothetical protein